jgi:hypothetical protein
MPFILTSGDKCTIITVYFNKGYCLALTERRVIVALKLYDGSEVCDKSYFRI